MRRVATIAWIAIATLVMPATASADCNGPACEQQVPVETSSIIAMLVILLGFVAIMAAAERPRR